jgi:ATP-binding cassette subfamily B protein
MLGERGVRMSGGQRQRLAVARALLRGPSILILDEATSALDAKTEAEILETLDEAARGRTTISITHRLSLSARSDHVFVLDQGRIVEQGTHAELARADGLYQRLYEEQMAHVSAGIEPVGIEISRLRTIPLFSELGSRELGRLAQRLTAERYAAGTEIVHQGDEGRQLCFIASGQVEVVVADEGRQRRINELNEGDFFGEMALLTGEPRVATVRATMPTELYSLSRPDFLSLLEHDDEMRRAVGETITARRQALDAATRAARRPEPVAAPASKP